MEIKKSTVVTLCYDLYVDGVDNNEELMERVEADYPMSYCHGEGMMLPAFENALEGKQEGEEFDFRIDCTESYGEYDTDKVLQLDKTKFYNGDGEFDDERVKEGLIVPMTTADGAIVNAQVVEITEDTVTIDLNHPLAGENLHFVGKILSVREATEQELQQLKHRCCGGCGGNENGCSGGCGGCNNCD